MTPYVDLPFFSLFLFCLYAISGVHNMYLEIVLPVHQN